MATAIRTPDAELVRGLRAREREAWERLYAEYQPQLRAFAFRLTGNVHDADDLVQETFVRAVPRLDRLDPETADLGAYLFATLKNLFLKATERSKRQQPVAEVPEPTLPTPIEDDPELRTQLTRQQEEVRSANGRLQPRQRLVLALRELEDRSYAEIGELVGMKENAVAQLIFRARESLRTELRLAQVDPEALPEECRRFLPLLAAHLDGQLKGAKRDATLEHLGSCERCQAALADMREASRRYRALPVLPSDDARAAVETRLDEVGYWTRLPRRTARRAALVGSVIWVVVLFAGSTAVGLAVFRNDDGPTLTDAEVAAETTTAVSTEESEPAGPTAPATTTTSTAAAKPATATTAPASTAEPPTTAAAATTAPAVTTTARDTRAPTVTITSAPPGVVATASVTIGFRADEASVRFTCRLDGGPPAPCVSPVRFDGLAPGAHTAGVRATDRSGNTGPEAVATWTYTPPDTTAPTTRILSGPDARTSDTSATFTFSADEPGVSFRCSLDGGAERACTSPAAYSSLAPGSHSFAVRATDAAGNAGPAATRGWTVFEPLPDLAVAALSKFNVVVVNRGQATAGPSVLTITLVGTFTVPSLTPGGTATFSWSICRAGTYTAVVDRTNAVRESNETNNTAARPNTCP